MYQLKVVKAANSQVLKYGTSYVEENNESEVSHRKS